MTLPKDIPDDVLRILQSITQAQEDIEKSRAALDMALDHRDHGIALLRMAGWTLNQIVTFTGLSLGSIRKISESQGVVAYRGARINGE